MTKFTSLSVAIASFVLSTSGIALAGGEGLETPAAGPNVVLPAGIQACIDQCQAAGNCCEDVSKLKSTVAEINKRLGKPGSGAARLAELERKLRLEITKGDQASIKAAKEALEAAVADLATKQDLQKVRDELVARIEVLEAAVGAQGARIDIHETKIENHETRIYNLEQAVQQSGPSSVSVSIGAKVGALFYTSGLYDYAAVPVLGDFRLNLDKVSLSLEGGALISTEAEDHGALGQVVATHQLGKGFGAGLGGQYFAGGFASDQRITFDGLNGLVRVEYLNGLFIANVDGLLGRAGNHTDGGSRDLGIGVQGFVGLNF